MNKLLRLIASIAMALTLVFGSAASPLLQGNQVAEAAALGPTDFAGIINYLKTHGNKLPANFLTKSQATARGWVSSKCNLATVAPGYSIGGDVFGNREGLLPAKSGRVYYEADAYYVSGCRGSKRVVWSNDGLYYSTSDHYATFTKW